MEKFNAIHKKAMTKSLMNLNLTKKEQRTLDLYNRYIGARSRKNEAEEKKVLFEMKNFK